ncbi:MAG: PIN domain-containing protein [Solirubrobacteraceae bacterium]
MPTRPEALGDTTAWIALRRGRPAAVASVRRLLRRGTLAVCDPVALELLRGARDARELNALRAGLALLPACAVSPSSWTRAQDVLEGLAHHRGGRHRGVPPMDLLIAAVAHEHDLPVLHDDAHFDLIAQVTGQPMIRLG